MARVALRPASAAHAARESGTAAGKPSIETLLMRPTQRGIQLLLQVTPVQGVEKYHIE